MTEDSTRFDVYGKAALGATAAAVDALLASGVYSSEMAVRIAVQESLRGGTPILIGVGLSWHAAQALRSSHRPFSEVLVVQEGCSVGDRAPYCALHELFYGGCLGCPVCSGDYVP
jgi:hypothetical protein